MGYADIMRTWSNINCGLASFATFAGNRSDGVNPQTAATNLCLNLSNGIARNEIAYEMARFGNPAGNLINMYSGYGNPTSNMVGTLGLVSACSPWMFFNSPCCYGGMGMGMGYSPYMNTGYMGWGMGGFCC